MKRMIKASIDNSQLKDIERYLRTAVRNIANYAYDNAHLSDDDPRADYFVENICEDSTVLEARDHLQSALLKAIENQKRR